MKTTCDAAPVSFIICPAAGPPPTLSGGNQTNTSKHNHEIQADSCQANSGENIYIYIVTCAHHGTQHS